MNKFPLSRNDKERKVIELYENGMNIRNIAKRVHMSFGDIGQITRKRSGDPYTIEKSNKFSKHSQALELFHNGESNLRVAIKLGLTDLETMEEQKQYQRLIENDGFCDFYDATKYDLVSYLSLHAELTSANLTAKDALEGLTYAKQLSSMRLEHDWLMNELQRLRQERLYACNELESLKQKKNSEISELETLEEAKQAVLNKIDLSIQQHQEVSPSIRIRRRRIRRTQSFDEFHTQGPS